MPNREIAELVLESAVDYAIVTMDLAGTVTSWSKGAENVLGWLEQDMLGKNVELFFTPEDRANGVPAREMSRAIALGRGTDERWHLRKDGSQFWASGEMLPLSDPSAAGGFLKILRDRTEQKKSQDLLLVLNQELTHRLKNQLAMVQGIVNQTLHRADDIEAARASIIGRLGVLSSAHSLLITGFGKRAAVRDVIEKSVNLHAESQADQIELQGPDIDVGPNSALALALILHELTTNAFKYGALSTVEGRVQIQWNVSDIDDVPNFKISWHEMNGPLVSVPASFGFGTRLIKSGIGGARNKVDIDYAPTGLRFVISLPMEDFQLEN